MPDDADRVHPARAADAGFALFESECLKWPGFVEFDDVNGKVLTYSVLDKAYRVWDMTNYEELYVMREPRSPRSRSRRGSCS